MTAILVPTFNYPNYTTRIRLDERDYLFRYRWQTRTSRWKLDISTDEEELLISGLCLIVNWPLLRYYHADDRVPSGELICVATSPGTDPPGLEELGEGKRCELTYYPLVT